MTEADHSLAAVGSGMCLRKVAGRIGAEISGVVLSEELSDAMIADLRGALLRHRVLFFRDQHHMDDTCHERFFSRFGEVQSYPLTMSEEARAISELDSSAGIRNAFWHTDISFAPEPAAISCLRAVTVPATGGDTIWADCVAAYEDLPAELKAFADKLRLVHSNAYDAGYRDVPDLGLANEEVWRKFRSTVLRTEHPLVHIHPETGERSLLIGTFAIGVAGYSAAASRSLTELFQAAVVRPENTVRWHWREGDVVMWDNRSTQHYAVDDYGDQPRILRRITSMGFAPRGVDGRSSRIRSKETVSEQAVD